MRQLLIAMFISLTGLFSFGQEYEFKKNNIDKFKIVSIDVRGAIHSDKKAIINQSGLRIGQIIELQGFHISNAITALTETKLYDNIEIYEKESSKDKVSLEIKLTELPILKDYTFKNVSKHKAEELKELVSEYLTKGLAATPTDKALAKKLLEDYYKAKGYANIEVLMGEVSWTSEELWYDIVFEIKKKEKVRITEIILNGNKVVSSEKLKKIMLSKDQAQLIKPTVYVADNIEMDKKALISYYRTIGYRDVEITKERIRKLANGNVKIYLQIEEGQKYFFRNITWEGNSKYKKHVLSKILNIKKCDIFNEQLLNQRLNYSPDGKDISSLYMDDGHLFFTAKVYETKIEGQHVDLMIIINEGDQLEIGEIRIAGNEITSDAVIRRELKTLPGEKFNRDAVMRSQRALMNLGYFDPETIVATPHPNASTGLVDLEYKIEEKSNDKFNVAGSWGGPGVGIVGTTGVEFNNFSLKKVLNMEGYKGEGQKLALNARFGGRSYQSINFNFTEPWLGQKKPNPFSVGSSFTNFRSQNPNENGNFEGLQIIGAHVGYGQRFRLGKKQITASTSLKFQQYRLNEWSRGLFQTDAGETVSDGQFNNLSTKQSFTHNNLNHPIFPTKGSRISLSMQLTPPFSLLSGRDNIGPTVQENFKWMEYHKWRLDAEKYIPVAKRFTIKLSGKLGYMGAYNKIIGVSPFERFQLGGDALTNSQIGFTGTDRITLRGYDIEDLENNLQNGEISATPIFNKFTLEFRVPVSKNSGTYFLGFGEAGNAYRSFKEYNPFTLKKSAGVGFRTHLPMLGTLGIDYGIGFDKDGPRTFSNLGQFSFTLGMELD